MNVSINASVDGHTLEEFQKLISKRQEYLKESASKSVVACAIDVLVSIRAATRTAKKRAKVVGSDVTQKSDLHFSFKQLGKIRKPCIRTNGGTEVLPVKGKCSILYPTSKIEYKLAKVFSFMDNHHDRKKQYLIVATSKAEAQERVKSMLQKRIDRYRGLGKLVLTKLMVKTNGRGQTQTGTSDAQQVAEKNHGVTQTTAGQIYTLSLLDQLDYATAALKGGPSAVNVAFQKALNKITSTINQKCKSLLDFKPLATPFPEVKTRR